MKTIVYIDGQNFLYRTSEVLIERNIISDKQDLTAINIRNLLEKMFPEEKLEIRFYGVAKIRREKNMDEATKLKSQRFADNLRRIKNSLAKQGIDFIASGTLLARDSEPCQSCGFHKLHFMEKGVDVSLATNLVNDAAMGNVDRVILLSSDMDMLPAIIIARKIHKKNVTYVGFAKRMVGSIISQVDDYKSIHSLDLIDAYLDANQKSQKSS